MSDDSRAHAKKVAERRALLDGTGVGVSSPLLATEDFAAPSTEKDFPSRGMITPADLRAFETEIAELFNDAQIPYPVHLADGNEEQLIEAFRDVRPEDWVLGSWRSHYHCLLKGVPRETLKRAILRGHSIALCFPKYRVLCSAIVGGSIPIAVGIAAGIAARGGSERVHCFMGDMTSESGIAWESIKYARRHDLPVRWVVEDNNLSVCTDTRETWGGITKWGVEVEYYEYRSKYPHAGAGIRVQF